jgi:hypothetical protein
VSASNGTSRRTFLKGAGLAGAAGLAGSAGLGPFLATASAETSTRLVLGVNAPGPWEHPGKGGGYVPAHHKTWHDLLPNALGCRSYNDHPFKTANANGASDDAYTVFGNPPRFPGQTINSDSGTHVPTKVVASIKPDPTALLNGALDGFLYSLILDGAQAAANGTYAGSPKLTVWHEAGNLYGSGSKYASYGLQPRTKNGAPTNGDAARTTRLMHAHMQGLCDQVKSDHAGSSLDGHYVTYGCIIYGQVDVMANNNDQEGPTNWVPKSTANEGATLDWYGIDVYYDSGKDWGRGDLDSYAKVDDYLSQWLAVAKNRSGGPSSTPEIHITECNANQHDEAARPAFFENLASWLNQNVIGGNPHMLTFFPQPAGPHSVSWGPPRMSTVQALQQIQKGTFG